MITYRQATVEDVDDIAEVEAASWPSSLAASREAIAERVTVYAAGQWVALLGDRIVGAASAQRINPPQLESQPLTYQHITDNGSLRRTHSPEGTIYQLVGVGFRIETNCTAN